MEGSSMNNLDISGHKYGKLSVVKRAADREYKSRSCAMWLCVCECGNETTVALSSLRSGNTKSCGCLHQNAWDGRKTQRIGNKTEYTAWSRMKQRCYDKNDKSFPDYGGRGITVSDEWIASFDTFLADMGARPQGGYSIERLDVNDGYSKSNCIWASNHAQARNKRNNIVIEFNGTRKILADWAADLGICWASLYERIQKWPLEKALTQPKKGIVCL